MRLQTIINTNDSLQITYVDEADIHTDTGIMTARTVDLPHHQLPQHLLDELVDSVEQILEHVRVVQRQPVEQFTAPR